MEKLESYEKQTHTVKLLIFLNLLLALVAFIKDVVFASYFGTSKIGDAISLAFFLPDTIGNNLIGSALAVSCIPIFTRLGMGNNLELWKKTQSQTLLVVLVITIILSILLSLLSEPIFRWFTIQDESTFSWMLRYFLMMVPIIIIAPIWLMGSSIMQASRSFIVPGITPILLNLLLLLGLLYVQANSLPLVQGGRIYSILITFSCLIVCLVTWIFLWKNQKVTWSIRHFQQSWKGTETKNLFQIFIPYLLILFFNQLSLFIERIYAGSLGTGTVAALTYAYRISQFPMWVFIAAINTFILPTISFHLGKNDFTTLKRDLIKSFSLVISISVFISLILVLFSDYVIELILLRGNFSKESVELTSSILKSYGLSIVGQSLYVFCIRYYVAENQMRLPLIIGLLGSCINIGLLSLFVPFLGPVGIGYAVTIASTLSGGILLWHFINRLRQVEKKGGVSHE